MDWHEQRRQTRLQEAISTGQLDTALAVARRTRVVPLADAAQIIALARDGEFQYYSRLCVRWVARFLDECNPSIEDLRTAVFALDQLPEQLEMLGVLLKLVEYPRPR